MSTVLEPTVIGGYSPKNGNGSSRRQIKPLGLNAQKVVAKRYSLKDENGDALETWNDIVRRVVGHVSRAEKDSIKRQLFYEEMTNIMLAREFVPNTPCLVNAGKPKRRVSCFKTKALVDQNGDPFAAHEMRHEIGIGPMIVVSEHSKDAITSF